MTSYDRNAPEHVTKRRLNTIIGLAIGIPAAYFGVLYLAVSNGLLG